MVYLMRILVVDGIGVVYCLYHFLMDGFCLIISGLEDFCREVLVMVDWMRIWSVNGVKMIFHLKCFLNDGFCLIIRKLCDFCWKILLMVYGILLVIHMGGKFFHWKHFLNGNFCLVNGFCWKIFLLVHGVEILEENSDGVLCYLKHYLKGIFIWRRVFVGGFAYV